MVGGGAPVTVKVFDVTDGRPPVEADDVPVPPAAAPPPPPPAAR